MRKTYILRDGKLVPKHRPKSDVHNVIGDLDPYESIVTGEMIGGRRQHRDQQSITIYVQRIRRNKRIYYI